MGIEANDLLGSEKNSWFLFLPPPPPSNYCANSWQWCYQHELSERTRKFGLGLVKLAWKESWSWPERTLEVGLKGPVKSGPKGIIKFGFKGLIQFGLKRSMKFCLKGLVKFGPKEIAKFWSERNCEVWQRRICATLYIWILNGATAVPSTHFACTWSLATSWRISK